MQKGIIAALLMMLTGAVVAQTDVVQTLNLTVGGITYTNVVFSRVTLTSVTVKHSTGVASIPLASLPADLQQRFGYDPARAAAYAKSVSDAKAKQAEEHWLDSAAVEFVGVVDKVTTNGAIIRTRNAGTRTEYSNEVYGGPPRQAIGTINVEAEYIFLVGCPYRLTFNTSIAFRAYVSADGSIEIDGKPYPKWVYRGESRRSLVNPRLPEPILQYPSP